MSCISFVSTIKLEQVWNWYRGQRNNQQQRQNTGVLRFAQNDKYFSYLYSICKAALKKPYAVAEEFFHTAHKPDIETCAILQRLCSNVSAFSSHWVSQRNLHYEGLPMRTVQFLVFLLAVCLMTALPAQPQD